MLVADVVKLDLPLEARAMVEVVSCLIVRVCRLHIHENRKNRLVDLFIKLWLCWLQWLYFIQKSCAFNSGLCCQEDTGIF